MTAAEPTIHDALTAIETIDNRGGPPRQHAAEYYRTRDLVLRYAASGQSDERGQLGALPALIPAFKLLLFLAGAGIVVPTVYSYAQSAGTIQGAIKEMVPWVTRGAGIAAIWWAFGRPGKSTLPALMGVGRPRQTKTVQTTYKDPLAPGQDY